MNRIFLSHGHADKPFVRLIAAELGDAGLAPWLDELELLPGDSLVVAISKAVADSTYVIAFLSPSSVTSAWVEKELAIRIQTIVTTRNKQRLEHERIDLGALREHVDPLRRVAYIARQFFDCQMLFVTRRSQA